MKVVIAENNEDMAEAIRALLTRDGQFEVVAVVSTADEVLKEIAESRPALVILDHFLSGGETGIQLAPKLKAASPNTRVLIFSGYDVSMEAEREPAVDSYLPKGTIRDLIAFLQLQLAER